MVTTGCTFISEVLQALELNNTIYVYNKFRSQRYKTVILTLINTVFMTIKYYIV